MDAPQSLVGEAQEGTARLDAPAAESIRIRQDRRTPRSKGNIALLLLWLGVMWVMTSRR